MGLEENMLGINKYNSTKGKYLRYLQFFSFSFIYLLCTYVFIFFIKFFIDYIKH